MINIYQITDSSFQAISAGTFDDPVSMQITPAGRAFVKKLFIRNDDSNFWYEDIEVKPVTIVGGDISNGSVSIKLISGDSKPKESQWAAAPTNSLSILSSPVEGVNRTTRIPELGTADGPDIKYYPFWIRVEGTKALPIGPARFSLSITYTENTI
jgi:hypothetical protein